MNYLVLIFVLSLFITIESASKKDKHKHKGMLTPYDGHHIDYNISLQDNERLNKVLPLYYLILLFTYSLLIDSLTH